MTGGLVASILVWVACGVLAYGGTLAFFQRKFPTDSRQTIRSRRAFSTIIACLGPIGLACTYAATGFRHGLLYRVKR